MKAGIRDWPGPDGAAERKVRVFPERHIAVAVDHLRRVTDGTPRLDPAIAA